MIQGATIIDDWIAEGEARGEIRGLTLGRIEEARRMTRQAITLRFGALPEQLAARIEAASADECELLFQQTFKAASLDELLS
jgi:hypothetical protein